MEDSKDDKVKINRLKVILVEKDISQKDFAKTMDLDPNTISRICKNEQQPTLKTLRRMALALDVNIRELLIPTKKLSESRIKRIKGFRGLRHTITKESQAKCTLFRDHQSGCRVDREWRESGRTVEGYVSWPGFGMW